MIRLLILTLHPAIPERLARQLFHTSIRVRMACNSVIRVLRPDGSCVAEGASVLESIKKRGNYSQLEMKRNSGHRCSQDASSGPGSVNPSMNTAAHVFETAIAKRLELPD